MFTKTKNTSLELITSQNGMLLIRLVISIALIAASLLFPEIAQAGPSPGTGSG